MFSIVCTLFLCAKKHTFKVLSSFQLKFCTSYVQFVQHLYRESFDLYSLCMQLIYKFSDFMIVVYILYSFCSMFLVRVLFLGRNSVKMSTLFDINSQFSYTSVLFLQFEELLFIARLSTSSCVVFLYLVEKVTWFP